MVSEPATGAPRAPTDAPTVRRGASAFLRDLVALPRGLRYMAAGALFFSVMSLLVKVGGRRLPSQEMVFARSATMLVLCWIGLRRRRLDWVHVERLPLLLLRGAFGFSALSCFYFSLVRLPLGDANVIQYTNPAFTAVLAAWVLHERLRPREIGAVAASLAGVSLVARPSFLFGGAAPLPLPIVGVALLGAFSSASAYVTVRRLGTEDPLVILFYFSLVGAVGSLAAGWRSMLLPNARELLVLLGIGVTTQVAQLFMTRGLQLERAGRATAVGCLQVVFAGILGILFFGERPDPLGLTGFLLVIAGTLALARPAAAPDPGLELRAAVEDRP